MSSLEQSIEVESDLFRKMLMMSFVAHFAIVLIFGMKAFLFPKDALDLTQNAIRVDVVDLPEKGQSEQILQPKIEEKKAKEENAAPPPPKEEKVVIKEKKESAIDKIKRQLKEEERKKALKEYVKEVEKQENVKKQEALKQALVKGNVVSPGSSLTGIFKLEFNEFQTAIESHVRPHWNLPQWLNNKNFRAKVLVHLDNTGRILDRKIIGSSGNPNFDEYAIKAIDDSNPFPPPPAKFADVVRVDGIIIGFPD